MDKLLDMVPGLMDKINISKEEKTEESKEE
jgi:uncharacterized spore protein YtfJ